MTRLATAGIILLLAAMYGTIFVWITEQGWGWNVVVTLGLVGAGSLIIGITGLAIERSNQQ